MKPRSERLHPDWRKWRATRRRELVALGMPPHDASQFAALEAQGRCNIAKLVGFNAARDAELVPKHTPSGLRFFLAGDLKDVLPAQRPLAEEMSRATILSF